MRIAVIDDEPLILRGFEQVVKDAVPGAEVVAFDSEAKLLAHAKCHQVDVAFLDIHLGRGSGLMTARALRELNPRVNLIFATGYGEYTGEAIRMHASGYLLKPVTAEMIRREMADLRYPVTEATRKGLWVQTFGNFEVYFDGNPLHFRYAKAKELFAILIDSRGSLCENADVQAVLLENHGGNPAIQANYFRQIRKCMLDTLSGAGRNDIFVQQRGRIGVIRERVPCDFYEWLNDRNKATETYSGEYMRQYEWAEVTHAWLERTSITGGKTDELS